MDAEFLANVNDLLRRCDEEQKAFELTHLTATPEPEPKKKSYVLTEAEVDARIVAKLEKFASMLGAEVGKIERRIRQELRAEFEAKVGELRAELSVLGAHGKGIVDLANWRHKDVA